VDNLGITVPGVTSINMKATVIQPPVHAYGPVGTSTPRSAQLRTEFDMALTTPLQVCLVLTCVNVPLTLKMYAEGAGGQATITNINCATTNTNDTVTLSATTNAVKLYVGQVTPDSAFTNTSAPATVSPATLATGTVLGVPINVTASNNMTFAGVNGSPITLGPGGYTRSGSVGQNSITTDPLATGLTINASLGALTVSGSSVQAILTPVLQAVDTSLYNVMSTLPLGIQFAGADLWNSKIDCGGRKLVG
jgi:tight adherence protein G